jgi:hypothetical protein
VCVRVHKLWIDIHTCNTIFIREVTGRPGVYWWDNFGGKAFAVAVQGMDLGSYKLPLWTGKGFHHYIGDKHIDLTLDVIKPGMPDEVFPLIAKNTVIKQMGMADKMGYDYLRKSLVKKYSVRRVPCKPEVDSNQDSKLHVVLQESRDGLVDFYPMELSDLNIGSRRGLFKIMRDEFDKWPEGPPPEYFVLSADCNIFSRIVKV